MTHINTKTRTSHLTLLADLGGGIEAELKAEEITISTGPKNSVILDRAAWDLIVGHSGTLDAILAALPLPAAPAPVYPEPKRLIYPELGAEIGGGFCAGRHPREDGAVLIISGGDGDFSDDEWQPAREKAHSYRAGGHEDWRLLTRAEALQAFELIGPHKDVAGFRKGEKHAFKEALYWTDQEYEFVSDCAWGQDFGDGHSRHWYKYYDYRVRPVRIHFI